MKRNELTEASEIMERGRFWSSRLLLSASDLDLFTLLDKGSIEVGEIFSKLKTDPRATKIFVDALCGQGFIEKK